jgi:hypothetical protein
MQVSDVQLCASGDAGSPAVGCHAVRIDQPTNARAGSHWDDSRRKWRGPRPSPQSGRP